jgi:hypothetical protein
VTTAKITWSTKTCLVRISTSLHHLITPAANPNIGLQATRKFGQLSRRHPIKGGTAE